MDKDTDDVIRWMLSLTPMQRLQAMQSLVEVAQSLGIEELPVHVMDLADVIASKEAAGRDKDRAVLPLLRRTLELKRGAR